MIKNFRLKTPRLIIKRMSLDDINDFDEWKSQENYHQYLPSVVKTRDENIDSLKKIIDSYEKQEQGLSWGVYYKGKLIGSEFCEILSNRDKFCRIGWGISPKYQRQGFAYEASKKFIDYLFSNYDLHRIEIVIWDGNDASKLLAKKLGFVQEGISREARFKNGKYFDLYQYGILKKEWEEMQKSQ